MCAKCNKQVYKDLAAEDMERYKREKSEYEEKLKGESR
jgi:hypothetical protein